MYIARDYNGELFMYISKPVRVSQEFAVGDELNQSCWKVNPKLFPEVSWENSPKLLKVVDDE